MEENIDDQVHWRTSTKMIITLNESTLLINPSHKRCFIFTIPFFTSRRSCKEPINFENALKTQILFVELLVSCLGLWVSSSLGFKARVDHSLVCFLARWSSELLKTILLPKNHGFKQWGCMLRCLLPFFLSMGKISTFSNSWKEKNNKSTGFACRKKELTAERKSPWDLILPWNIPEHVWNSSPLL